MDAVQVVAPGQMGDLRARALLVRLHADEVHREVRATLEVTLSLLRTMEETRGEVGRVRETLGKAA